MELTEILKTLFNAIVVLIIIMLIGSDLYRQPQKVSIKRKIAIIMIYLFLTTINQFFITSFLKMITTYCIFSLTFRLRFKLKVNQLVVGTFLTYSTVLIGEAVVVFALGIIFFLFGIASELGPIKNDLFLNIIILMTSYFVYTLLKSKFKGILSKLDQGGTKLLLSISLILLILFGTLFYKIVLTDWSLNIDFFANLTLILFFSGVGFFMINQKIEAANLSKTYWQLADYSKRNEGMIEEYRIDRHKNESQLLEIRNLIDKENKELLEYVDKLIEKQRHEKKFDWIDDLKYIHIPGIQGFLNYKVMEIEDNQINFSIEISSKLNNIDFQFLTSKERVNFYSILGILLDNAIRMATESPVGEIIMSAYVKNGLIVFEVANTYIANLDIQEAENKNNQDLIKKIIRSNAYYSKEFVVTKKYIKQKLNISLKPTKKM